MKYLTQIRLLAFICSVLLLPACGGGGGAESVASPADPEATNEQDPAPETPVDSEDVSLAAFFAVFAIILLVLDIELLAIDNESLRICLMVIHRI